MAYLVFSSKPTRQTFIKITLRSLFEVHVVMTKVFILALSVMCPTWSMLRLMYDSGRLENFFVKSPTFRAHNICVKRIFDGFGCDSAANSLFNEN